MRLLLHICCGPCACYPLKKLRADGIEPVGYFFNPNIHPYKEWDRRLASLKDFAEKTGMKLISDEHYMVRDFLRRALLAEGTDEETDDDGETFDVVLKRRDARRAGRCRMCYSWRLGEAARFAASEGFDAFTSTLFYSIYQDHELMRRTAEHLAKSHGVRFYYEDFRAGWQEGKDISLDMGLYRQPYCGCIFSEEERYSRAIRRAEKAARRARSQAGG